MIPIDRTTLFAGIAKEHLNIATLQTQGSDSLDFHDCAVWGLEAALQAAFEAGAACAKDEALPADSDEPMIRSGNEAYGFFGTWAGEHGRRQARVTFDAMARAVMATFQTDARTAMHFLDSKPGRWLAEAMLQGEASPLDRRIFTKWHAGYSPDDFDY